MRCARTRHRAISWFFFRIFLIVGYQILMILSDFGGPGAHFLMIFEYFGCLGTRPGGLGHILSPRLGFLWFWRFGRHETLPPFWHKNHQKSSKNRSQTQQFFRSLFWSTLEPSWGRFGRIWGPTWSQNWSRIGPKSDHEENSKIIKIRWFLQCFEASKAPEIDQKSLLRRC